MAKFPKRIDANQKEIVKTFRSLGATVLILSEVGKGCPDICVGIDGKNYLFEIKNGNNPISAQKLTEAEQVFFNSWKGHARVIKSIVEVVHFMDFFKSCDTLNE